MSTYILKDNQQTGPYGQADIARGLADGRFSYDDLAWREGLGGWQPLRTLHPPEISARSATPPPLPIITTASSELASFQQRGSSCRFCGGEIPATASKCRHCGEWLHAPANTGFSNTEIKTVPPSNAVIFTIITLGIYQLFWLHRIFKELHSRGATQTTPGQAVGFLFIPFFNLGWIFVVWKRLGDAVVREYANAGLPLPTTAVVWLAPIAVLLGVAELFFLPIVVLRLILLPISIGNAQAWMNHLAALPGRSFRGTRAIGGGVTGETKPCPTCGESLPLQALICRYCGHRFSERDIAVLQQQDEERAARVGKLLHLRSLRSKQSTRKGFGIALTVLGSSFLLMCIAGVSAGFAESTTKESELGKLLASIAFGIILFGGAMIYPGLRLLRTAKKIKKQLNELSEPKAYQEITGANAGGPRPLPIRTRLAARIAQFWRSA
jgi:ribosomal protein L40E